MGRAGNKNFSGCAWRKSLTEEYIKKKKYSGTAEIKSVSFLGTFFFSPKSRTPSVALRWFILMQPGFHLSVNKMHWTGTLRSILRSRLLPFFFISSVYYLQHDRHQPRLAVDWAGSQYTLVSTCRHTEATGGQNHSCWPTKQREANWFKICKQKTKVSHLDHVAAIIRVRKPWK